MTSKLAISPLRPIVHTLRLAPICLGCKHLRAQADLGDATAYQGEETEELADSLPTGTCDAFPEGIPIPIWRSVLDHRTAVRGDHDITFEATDDRATRYAALLFRDR